MFLFSPVFSIALRRKFPKVSIATVLFMTPVVVYAPLLHLSFLLPLICLVIGLGQVHVVGHGVGTRVHSHGLNDQEKKVGIPLVSQTKEERIGTSETEMAQEQSVRENACILVSILINLHLIQVHRQIYDHSFPRFCPSSCYLKSVSPC